MRLEFSFLFFGQCSEGKNCDVDFEQNSANSGHSVMSSVMVDIVYYAANSGKNERKALM